MSQPLDASSEVESNEARVEFPFESEFASHRQAVAKGDVDNAIQSFVLLQTNCANVEEFQHYLIELVDHIDPSKNSKQSQFFASLPALIQSTIIEQASDYLEADDDLHKFQVFYDYIQAYPRHAYKYLTRAIQLLMDYVDVEDQVDHYMELLATELLPRFWKQRVLIVEREGEPSVKSTDSKHFIVVPRGLFEQYVLIGQRYYISKRLWSELVHFTCAMLDCVGYTGLHRLDTASYMERFLFLREKRNEIQLDEADEDEEDLSCILVFVCEYVATSAQFVQFAYEYYRAVCVMDGSENEKACLIPICAIQPLPSSSASSVSSFSEAPSQQTSPIEEESVKSNDPHLDVDEEERRPSKRAKNDTPSRGEGLDAYCMRGVDEALLTLSKAADCMRHIVGVWQWATTSAPNIDWKGHFGDWEQRFCVIIESYQLPFNIYNGVLLVRSDLALSSPSIPGNLAKALKLSQTICDRIELQRRKERQQSVPTSPGRISDFDIPFMFAFRVLYNISVIYLLVGSLQQSTLEVAIILSVFPIPSTLDEKDFVIDETDCQTAASVFVGREFGLIRVTQEGLVVRCIKHLMVSLYNEATMRGGLASIESAMRWDETAGSMIVLMQYAWPYWRTRTNIWPKIAQRMQEKRSFRNRSFLEYLYVPEILETIQKLHQSQQVTMDIIPPEFALRVSVVHPSSGSFDGSNLSSSPHIPVTSPVSTPSPCPSESMAGSVTSPMAASPPDKSSLSRLSPTSHDAVYQPQSLTSTSPAAPSATMTPSWYSTSTRKNMQTKLMSPSFYYSRPVASLLRTEEDDAHQDRELMRPRVPPDVVTRCIEYRMRKYSPKMTPQRMRHVLQKFLKAMVLKSNGDA